MNHNSIVTQSRFLAVLGPLVFFNLYSYKGHEYYSFANSFFILAAFGFVLA